MVADTTESHFSTKKSENEKISYNSLTLEKSKNLKLLNKDLDDVVTVSRTDLNVVILSNRQQIVPSTPQTPTHLDAIISVTAV